MKRVNLLVLFASFLLIAVVAVTFYYFGERNATLEAVSENQATFPFPFSLTGGGLALGIARWFYKKIVLIATTIFKLVIGFLLLLAAGMAVAVF